MARLGEHIRRVDEFLPHLNFEQRIACVVSIYGILLAGYHTLVSILKALFYIEQNYTRGQALIYKKQAKCEQVRNDSKQQDISNRPSGSMRFDFRLTHR